MDLYKRNDAFTLKLLRVIVYKIQILAGHCTPPILLRFGMQFWFRVLTTKWMLKSSNSFYFGKYREGRFRVTLTARHYGGSKEFLLHEELSFFVLFISLISENDKFERPTAKRLEVMFTSL